MKHRLRQFEAAQLVAILRPMRADTWPPVVDEFLRDLARIVAQTAQSDALVLEVRAAWAKDDLMATVSLSEAGRRLGVHRSTIARQISRGELPAVLVGARSRVRVVDLERVAGSGEAS